MPTIIYMCLEISNCSVEQRKTIFTSLANPNIQCFEFGYKPVNPDEIKTEAMLFDFNKVIQMPKALELWTTCKYNDVENKIQTAILKGQRAIVRAQPDERDMPEIKVYGAAVDWYRWSLNNWGTKWNASEAHFSKKNPDRLVWRVANSPCFPVIAMLSQQHPEQVFRACYASESEDEIGYCEFKAGLVDGHKETTVEWDSKEGIAIRDQVEFEQEEIEADSNANNKKRTSSDANLDKDINVNSSNKRPKVVDA